MECVCILTCIHARTLSFIPLFASTFIWLKCKTAAKKEDELSSEKSSSVNDETASDNISIEDGAVSNQTENETIGKPYVSSLQYLLKCLVNSKSTDYASTVEKAVSLRNDRSIIP